MKKLVLFFALVTVVGFSACSNKTQTAPATEQTPAAQVDTTAAPAPADTTATPAQ